MVFRSSPLVFCLLGSALVALLGPPAAQAQTIDPHALYEQRCSGCHAPHASDFARDTLERRGDTIVLRHTGKDLRPLLARGHGKLSPPEIDLMAAHFAFILEAGALFRDKCFICHGRAVVFARSALILRNGTLYGRYSGRETARFMVNHGRLNGPQVATVVTMLKGQLGARTSD